MQAEKARFHERALQNERKCKQMSDDILRLTDKVESLNGKIKTQENTSVLSLQKKIVQQEDTLQDLQKLNHDLSTQCRSALNERDREVNFARHQMLKMSREVESLNVQIDKLKAILKVHHSLN